MRKRSVLGYALALLLTVNVVLPGCSPPQRAAGKVGTAVAGPFKDALSAYGRGDYATAMRLLRPLADQGDGKASYLIGLMYASGQGVPEDYAEAARQRIVWVLEQMFVEGLLEQALVVGERKGGVTILAERKPTEDYKSAVHRIARSLPSDTFSATVEPIAEATNMIVNDDVERVCSYVRGIVALWDIRTKDCEFTTQPFE
jgi:hypothetical protein